MDEVTPFIAVVLGVVQGVTELLPISSSGHLVLLEHLFGLDGSANIFFDVMLHIGSLGAILVYFGRDWISMIITDRKPLFLIIIGTIPAGIIGILFENIIKEHLRSPWVVVFTLFIAGIIMYFADKTGSLKRRLYDMGLSDAIIIGLSQCLALAPGVSRSGITMSAALFLGLKREEAARFSFLLSCPIIMGAGLVEAIKHINTRGTELDIATLLLSMMAAFISGLLVIHFLMNFLKKHSFVPFVIYRLVLSLAVGLSLVFLPEPAKTDELGPININGPAAIVHRLQKGVVNITSKEMSEGYNLYPTGDAGLISGVIIDNQGHVVTDGAGLIDRHAIEVALWNGDRWPARFLGEDPISKIAVLAIEAPKKILSQIDPLKFTIEDDVLAGEFLMIIGNSMGMGTSFMHSMAFSAPRSLQTNDGFVVDGVIILDRPIVKGLMGGALLKESGVGIGVITGAFYPRDTGVSSLNTVSILNSQVGLLGFSIPFSYVLRVAASIIAKGKVDHVWLGATCETITPSLARLLGLHESKGVIIFKVIKGSPAWRAGLRGGEKVSVGNRTFWIGGDIILEVNGKEVSNLPSFVKTLEEIGPENKVSLTIIRNGQKRRIMLTLKGLNISSNSK